MPFTFCVTRRSQGAVSHPDGCLYEDALHIPTQISLSSRNAAPHPGSCVILLRMLLLMPTEFGLLFPGTLSFMCLLRSLVLLRTLVGSLPLSSRNVAPHSRNCLVASSELATSCSDVEQHYESQYWAGRSTWRGCRD